MKIIRTQSGPRMSQAVCFNQTIYLAGQVANNINLGAFEQTNEALENIDKLLALHSSHRGLLLSAQIYLKSMEDFDQMNRAWEQWISMYPGATPARATIEAKMASEEYLVEIVVVAAADMQLNKIK
ncbi:RidA family protein [Comamonas sp. MYb396]